MTTVHRERQATACANLKRVWTDNETLGESALWHPIEKALYWIDIVEKKLHRLDVKTNQHQLWIMPTEVGTIVPNATGGLLIALRTGIALLNPVSDQIHYLCKLPDNLAAKTRFNDGHCDRQGRFWVGTIDLEEKNPLASIFRLDKNKLILQDENYICSNGLVSSLDSRYFYICESARRIIYRYDFDVASGTIHNKKIFAKIADDAGFPDGLAIDSEGYIWNAHINGWVITRYSPDGKIDRVITLPTQGPTSICFGGDDLKTLYITTAKRDVPLADVKNQPYAGNVFSIAVDVAGVPEPMWQGSS